MVARAEELGQVVREEREGARRRAKELQRLVTGTTKVAVPVVLATVAEVDPWLEAKADDAAAPAISLVMEAARVCHGHAHQAAVGDGPGLHQRLQRLAGELVAATAAAPKLSRKVWNAPDPPTEAMREGQEATWAALVWAQERFALVHWLAGVVRMMGGLGASVPLPDGAPAWGYAYRQWAKVYDQQIDWSRACGWPRTWSSPSRRSGRCCGGS